METIQMLGFTAFIVASFVLGTRLVLLWRRTGQIVELAMGLSFLMGGGLGYATWFAYSLVMRAGNPDGRAHAIAVVALALTCLGAFTNATGIRWAFRASDARARVLLWVFAVLMAAGWLQTLRNDSGREHWTFWLAMLTACASYVWSSAECLRLFVVLRKRARFGLAAPHLPDRARLWSIAFGAVVVMIASSFTARLVLGPNVMPPPAVSTFQSLCGMVCASAIWLGFFPPAAYRRHFERRAAGAA